MKVSSILARHVRETYFGKNLTWVNLKDTLADVTYEEALTKVNDLNTIAALAYHIHYYFWGQLQVLKGGPLEIRDKYAFDHPEFPSEESWQAFLDTLWTDMEEYVRYVEQLSDEQLEQTFVDEKYGTYCRNILGVMEHAYYHLGQITLVKKLVRG